MIKQWKGGVTQIFYRHLPLTVSHVVPKDIYIGCWAKWTEALLTNSWCDYVGMILDRFLDATYICLANSVWQSSCENPQQSCFLATVEVLSEWMSEQTLKNIKH